MSEETPAMQNEDESAEPASTRDEMGDLRRHNEELATKLKYLQAEFENYRKRVERDAETVVRFAYEALFARLLPVLDELDAAAAGIDGKTGEGVRMVRDNFVKALREAGLGEVPAEGLPFDPYVMDCIQQVPDDASKDGVVKEVVRKGYRYRDRIVRPAQVIVVNNRGETNG